MHLEELALQVLALFRPKFTEKRIIVDANLSNASANIPADPEKLAQVFRNLLQNAYKYTGEEKRIALRAYPERKGVAIAVQDNGHGIAKAERKRIFERFYRADDLLTRRTEGSGLGLSIAKRIVEAHGGRISVKSERGKGSTFTVMLSEARASQPDRGAAAS